MKKDRILQVQDGEVFLAGYPLNIWLEKFGLPIHILYSPVIRENLRAFKRVFEDYYLNYQVCYAAKACTHPEVLKIVNEEWSGVDVASYNEARCALEAGIPPKLINVNGNCKEDFFIEEAIKKDMLIIADSIEEFKVISRIAGKLNIKPRVLIRISGYDLDGITGEDVFTAGLWTKFGVSLKDIPEFINSLDNYPQVNFCGFHTHIGSQITALEPYLAVLGKIIEMGLILKERGKDCRIINLGGGYPVSYIDKNRWNYMLEKIREGYLKAEKGDMSDVFVWNNSAAGFIDKNSGKVDFKKWRGEEFFSPYPGEEMLEAIFKGKVAVNGKEMAVTEGLKAIGEPLFIIEPGRSIVDEAGVTLARVGFVRKVAGNNLVTLEMGVTNHSEALIEKIVRQWEIITDYHKKDKEPFECFVGGNLCFSGDMISRYKISLQREPVRGDVLIIHDTGGYSSGFLASTPNSFPRPHRLLVLEEEGKIRFIKKKDKYEEIFSLL